MNRTTLNPGQTGGNELGARARLNEIDRRLRSLRVRSLLIRWAYLPLLVAALMAMVVGLVLGMGEAEAVAGGIFAIAGAVAGFMTFLRKLQADRVDLEDERTSRLRELEAPSGAEAQRLGVGEDGATTP